MVTKFCLQVQDNYQQKHYLMVIYAFYISQAESAKTKSLLS